MGQAPRACDRTEDARTQETKGRIDLLDESSKGRRLIARGEWFLADHEGFSSSSGKHPVSLSIGRLGPCWLAAFWRRFFGG
jgi:hypothetical protein